ncbi:MAG: DegV family protein [Clostridia bacterium]|nr:DegV family protein [Clostridia bacterium]
MQKTGIITDTNSGMTQAEARECGVTLMPMPFTVNGKNYVENVNMSYMEFFEHLAGGAQVATSQPSPEDVMVCWKKALEDCDKLIYIPMSSALSSSCQSAKLFAEDFDGRVLVADNRRISISQKQSVYDALHWRDMGLSAEEILQKLMDTALDASIYLTVDDLSYLKRGGRITPSVATIGTVLNIKPVLQIQGGKLDTYKKVRGLHAAQHTMLEAIRKDLDTRFAGVPMILRTAYTGDAAIGKAWNAQVQEQFPEYQVTGDPLPISIACHVGPGVIALGLIKKII